MKVLLFLLFILAFSCTTNPVSEHVYRIPQSGATSSCFDVVQDFLDPALAKQKFYVGGKKSHPITYGLEVEYVVDEAPLIWKDYRPRKVSEEVWAEMSLEDQLIMVKEIINKPRSVSYADLDGEDIVAAVREAFSQSPFVKRIGAPESFPESLFTDPTGNVEFNGMVFSTIEETKSFIESLVTRYGRGSWQGHVVWKNNREISGQTGYSIFQSDMAQFSTLVRGHARHQSDPDFTPGSNISHVALMPMSENQRLASLNHELASLSGGKMEESEARLFYGPFFRDDPYPDGHVGYEMRQFHKRHEDLIFEMTRLSQRLENNSLNALEEFSSIEMGHERLYLDRFEDLGISYDHDAWEQVLKSIGEQGRGRYLFSSLSFALRDWENYPLISALTGNEKREAIEKIRRATRQYIEELNKIVEEGRRIIYKEEQQAFEEEIEEVDEVELDELLERTEEAIGGNQLPEASREVEDAANEADHSLSDIEASIRATMQRLDQLQREIEIREADENSSYQFEDPEFSGRAIERIRIAMARWANDSDLLPLFNQYRYAESLPRAPTPRRRFNGAIDGFEESTDITRTGRNVTRIKANPDLMKEESYQSLMERSVEVIFSPSYFYGHVQFRVGKKLYGMELVKKVKNALFEPRMGKEGKRSVLFRVGKDQVQEFQSKIEKLLESSQKYNIPPFDAHAPLLKIVEGRSMMGKRTLRFSSPSPKPSENGLVNAVTQGSLANNSKVDGIIVEEAGQFFLESPSGIRWPLQKIGDEYYAQSISCSQGIARWFEEFLGLDVGEGFSAPGLIEHLEEGNVGGRLPDLFIDYH